jgi:hypothetical protein
MKSELLLLAPAAVAAVLLALPSTARAASPPAPAPEEAPVVEVQARPAAPADPVLEPKDEDRTAYISISPFHLALPMVELTGEFKAHRKIGVAVIGGVGSVTVNGTSTSGLTTTATKEKFGVWEVGGQLVSYPVGHFDHGMQLGVEVLYMGLTGSNPTGGVDVTGAANGLAMGPFVGYKLATRVGFSFNVQGGAEYVTARATANAGTATASASASAWIPLLNINVGWSF